LLAAWPAASEPSAPKPDAPVARFASGESISESDLEAWIKNDLYDEAMRNRNDAERHGLRAEAARRLMMERLLEREEKRRGLDTAALLDELGRRAPKVEESEVKAAYEANRDRFGGRSWEEMAPGIRAELERERRNETVRAELDAMLANAGYRLLLEPPRAKLSRDGASLGAEDAPVTLVQFTDYECPYCRRAEPVVARLRERYGERLRLVVRHLPLEIHRHARPAALAAACARRQGRFFEYHAALFENPRALALPDLEARAVALGLDMNAFRGCLSAKETAKEIDADLEEAERLGVTGTPAFFVNGILLAGQQPFESFTAVIDAELARKQASR
jgi:protein-disulfide isomerase